MLAARRRVVGHGDDGPGHDLARPVVGDVAAAVGLDDDGVERLGRDEEVLGHRAHAQGVGRRVLEDQQVVVARVDQRALEVVGLGEGDAARGGAGAASPLAPDVEAREELGDAL